MNYFIHVSRFIAWWEKHSGWGPSLHGAELTLAAHAYALGAGIDPFEFRRAVDNWEV